jgi:hypothetical protein
MPDEQKPSFDPFVTVSLGNHHDGQGRWAFGTCGSTAIALVSNCPGVTAIHWYDAPAARRLVADIQALIDKLDPPPVKLEIITPPLKKRGRKVAKKARKAKRK